MGKRAFDYAKERERRGIRRERRTSVCMRESD